MKPIKTLYFFNPDNEMAIAFDSPSYMPKANVVRMIDDMATLPLCFSEADDAVLISHAITDADFLPFQEQVWGELPQLVTPAQLPDIVVGRCNPWGWNPRVCKMLAQHTSISWNETKKMLYSRLTARDVLARLCEELDLPRYLVPQVCRTIAEIEACDGELMIKAPWSSSGRGVVPVNSHEVATISTWVQGILRRQGFVTVEKRLDRVLDFAVEFRMNADGVEFLGYSVFETSHIGAYLGNKLGSQSGLEITLLQYVEKSVLQCIVERLREVLSAYITHYEGYLGVDMMIYRNEKGEFCVQPCVEINFRCTMGIVALQLSQRLLSPGRRGVLSVVNYTNDNEAYSDHLQLQQRLPLVMKAGKMDSGYLNLTPISSETRFVAQVITYA